MGVNEKMTAIADAIRDKTGKTEALGLDAMAESIGDVYEAGQKSEYDLFWDNFQDYGNRRMYYGAFAGWNDTIFKPKYPIKCITNTSMFYMSTITDVPVIDCSEATALSSTFSYTDYLATIEKWILKNDGSQAFNTPFQGCRGLVNIVVEGVIGKNGISLQWATKLSKASITSFVDALSSTTSGLTITFSKTAKEAVFAADEWAALIATKSNWTISLV